MLDLYPAILAAIIASTNPPNEVFSKPSHFIERQLMLQAEPVTVLNADIIYDSDIEHQKKDYFRGDSAAIINENNHLYIINNGYRTYKDLLGQYTENGKQVLVKINLPYPVEPFSKYRINTLAHADKLRIINTAALFNGVLEFNGKNCSKDDNNGSKNLYCYPLAEEQAVYLTGLAHINYFYNSVDLMPTYMAWANSGIYKGLDLSDNKKNCLHYKYCQDADDKYDYLYESLYQMALPNHKTTLKTLVNPSTPGLANGLMPPPFGEHISSGFAAISSKQIKLTADSGEIASFYNFFHHEMTHTFGFDHASGMSYGFSDVIKQAFALFYRYEEAPLFELPEYVFQVKTLEDKKLLVTIHSTANDHTQKKLTIDTLGIVDNELKITAQGNNQFILETKIIPTMRFFLRVYGDDSRQVMSQLLYPADFVKNKKLITHENKDYYLLTNKEWRYIQDYSIITPRIMGHDSVVEMCRGWFGLKPVIASADLLELLHTTYAYKLAGIESSVFLGKENTSDSDHKRYFPLEDRWQAQQDGVNIIDSMGNILCRDDDDYFRLE